MPNSLARVWDKSKLLCFLDLTQELGQSTPLRHILTPVVAHCTKYGSSGSNSGSMHMGQTLLRTALKNGRQSN